MHIFQGTLLYIYAVLCIARQSSTSETTHQIEQTTTLNGNSKISIKEFSSTGKGEALGFIPQDPK